MEQNRRNNGTDWQRNSSRPKKKEGPPEDRNPTSTTRPTQPSTTRTTTTPETTEKTKHRRFKKHKPTNIHNLSRYQLTSSESRLLEKGLNFIPTPYPEHPARLLQDYLLFDRKLRLKYHFHHDSTSSLDSSLEEEVPQNDILHPSSGWTPNSGQDPFLDAFRSNTLKDILNQLDQPRKLFKKNLKKDEFRAIQTLADNTNIVIKPADKGGKIVILNKEDYIQEGLRQLENLEHYEVLEEDPTKEFNGQILSTIKHGRNLGVIDSELEKILYKKNPRLATFYMLPKIHKPSNPGRPIVNSIGTITEKISAYIDEKIKGLVPSIPSFLKDTSHLLQTLLGRKLEDTDILVTWDVTALYTNIPHNEGIDSLNRKLEEANTPPLEKLFILRLAHLVLTRNYFRFNNKIYLQKQGTAMGTRMAPNYANIFMGNLEEQLLARSPRKPKLWLRFIDDIFFIWTHGEKHLEEFLQLANNFHPTIKFTMTMNRNELAFLDTVIYRGHNNYLLTRLYHKPTDSKLYLHFESAHPYRQKSSVPFGLLIRARRICSEEHYFELEASKIVKKLKERKYPSKLLEDAYNKVAKMNRLELIYNTRKKESSKTRLITPYNPSSPNSRK